MAHGRGGEQAFLFTLGAIFGFMAREIMYFRGALQGGALQWVRSSTASTLEASAPVQGKHQASLADLDSLPPLTADLKETCRVAEETAVNGQVMVFIGDYNVFSLPEHKDTLIYQTLASLIKFKVNNILLVATDPKAYDNGKLWIEYVSDKGIRLHVLHRDIATPGVLNRRALREQQSAKKFPVLRDLLMCGVNLLLSDFDVLFWDNPFTHIVGDADVEGMTDGWDYNTIFGWEIPLDHPTWFPPWEWRVEFLNSGFFYVRASGRTVRAMNNTWSMLTKSAIWDQAAYNCQVRAPLGTPARGRLHGEGLRIRVMDVGMFCNSRKFHMIVDPKIAESMYLPADDATPTTFKWPTPWNRPVAMHVNYHKHKIKMMAYANRIFAKVSKSR
mmetsp:Transcript_12473/g.25321  ORF Transcript_12473/g.25321 Transcript_12473/m.25321 type:complete len:387 (+) Transcript_12473:71-1231(+)